MSEAESRLRPQDQEQKHRALRARLDSQKDEVLVMIRDGLDSLGFSDIDTEAISLYVRRAPITCPAGQKPYWGPIDTDHGTEFGWTCVPDDQG
ncbi:MAG: hypothetical protein QOJ39_1523 [Candidatus Eremiobacteraeota bacterium]|jgi:hypothetical protein|nr:hypothetical protein [Candidatus Eremiobacteraeota bacterium]